MGMTIFIEGKSAALSYASIFNSLWKQTEIYEQLKKTFLQFKYMRKCKEILSMLLLMNFEHQYNLLLAQQQY